jgi:hypothetical protein
VRVDPDHRRRYPWWQLVLLGLAGMFEAAVWPVRRMWRSNQPLDTYGLCHLASVAGDTLLAIALANSIFFSLPVDQAKLKVAEYLGLTMLPLALAGPLLVPLLDRAGPRRAISFGSAAGRAIAALLLAPRVGTIDLFPIALALLVLSKVHAITKNGLTMAYADPVEGLMRSNARLGRIAVAGAIVATPLGILGAKLGGSAAPLYLAAAVYAVAAGLNLRLPHPTLPRALRPPAGPRGRVPALAGAALGSAGMRAASGFLLFLMAFALRNGGQPTYWFGLLAGGGVAGGFLGDLAAPRLPVAIREEVVVIACVIGAGVGALLGYGFFRLPVLIGFALLAGAASEFGRLAFQSLMQRHAPAGAFGRVFVRYEVVFQLAWVTGAFLPAVLPLSFREGILFLAGFYMALAVIFFTRPMLDHADAPSGGPDPDVD